MPAPPDPKREKAIFESALELSSSAARAAYLHGASEGDPALRKRLEALIAAHEGQPSFLPGGGSADSIPTSIEGGRFTEGAGSVIGRYKLLEKLGEGGFGSVWAAEQREPVKRRVALKIIKLGMDTQQVVARFEAERQALALMDHPNIARVLDAGATERPLTPALSPGGGEGVIGAGRPYFVMELVKGVPITRYCDGERLGTRDRLDLFIKVCQAIQHAHQKGIIHRDVKPSNILVTLHDGVPVPKVIDFGIAKATQQELTELTIYTQHHQFIGTPAYMSPEQAEMSGLDIDTRSDIYSLGVLLYELLTGTTPFDTKELMRSGIDEMRRIIREREPVRPSTRVSQNLLTRSGTQLPRPARHERGEGGGRGEASPPRPSAPFDGGEGGVSADSRRRLREIRGDLDWIVMKCLEKDRARRYETANGLAADLKRYLDNEPVTARPPTAAYRLERAWRRNRTTFTAVGAVAATLFVGAGISIWQALRATEAGQLAKSEAAKAGEALDVAIQKSRLAEEERERAELERKTAQRHLYVATLNLVQQAWEENNVYRMRQLLEEASVFPELGFEWYYWQRQAHMELHTLRGHLGAVRAVAFSHDGERIITGGTDAVAKIWDASTGQELMALKGHRAEVAAAAYFPNGERIVTGSWDQTAIIWDAGSGQKLHTLVGHEAVIPSVAVSGDGRWIATGSEDQTARVWDAATGRERVAFKGHNDRVWSVAFLPDNRRIITGSWDQTARVWEAESGRELITLEGHRNDIHAVAASPNGKWIATGSEDGTAKVWDIQDRREHVSLASHRGPIVSVAFSPDSQRLLTGSHDRTVKVWDVATGRELFTLRGHHDTVRSAVFSPNGLRIATGSWDRTAKLWEASPSREVLDLTGHRAAVAAATFSPDGRRVITASWDQTARVWQTDTGRASMTLGAHADRVLAAAISNDGRRIVTGSWDQTARIWESATGTELVTLKGHRAGIRSVAFSPDGGQVVTAGEDQVAKVWDSNGGGELFTLQGHTGQVWSVAFSPDGLRIVTGGADQTARVWDAASGRELRRLTGHRADIWCVGYSPDGLRIVTGSADATARLWETGSGKELLTLQGHNGYIFGVDFSPDGQRIVTGSADTTAKVWETISGKELLTLKGHEASIRSVQFSPDGQRVLTAAEDQHVRVWQAASPSQVTAWLEGEHAVRESLTALQNEQRATAERERALLAQDAGAIRQWLILAPIPVAGQSGEQALDQEPIGPEDRLHPTPGERVRIGARELVWRPVELEDYRIDYNALLGEVTLHSVAYAATYIQCDSAQSGLLMKLGSDDQAKVYLNGKEVYRHRHPRPHLADLDVVEGIALKAGLNALIFKVINETASWEGSLRLTDASGGPVRGIRVRLDPSIGTTPAAEPGAP